MFCALSGLASTSSWDIHHMHLIGISPCRRVPCSTTGFAPHIVHCCPLVHAYAHTWRLGELTTRRVGWSVVMCSYSRVKYPLGATGMSCRLTGPADGVWSVVRHCTQWRWSAESPRVRPRVGDDNDISIVEGLLKRYISHTLHLVTIDIATATKRSDGIGTRQDLERIWAEPFEGRNQHGTGKAQRELQRQYQWQR